jgi:hypothetical protein
MALDHSLGNPAASVVTVTVTKKKEKKEIEIKAGDSLPPPP